MALLDDPPSAPDRRLFHFARLMILMQNTSLRTSAPNLVLPGGLWSAERNLGRVSKPALEGTERAMFGDAFDEHSGRVFGSTVDGSAVHNTV